MKSELAKAKPFCLGSWNRPPARRKYNLGSAILAGAIEDYQGMDEEMHDDAKQFLFPQTQERQDHYDWVVSLAEGVNPAWLREALDKAKGKWDEQRARS